MFSWLILVGICVALPLITEGSSALEAFPEFRQVQESLGRLVKQQDSMERKTDAMTNQIDALAKRTEKAKHFFSAGATKDNFVRKGSTVVFDKVWANSGHYSASSGVFTAPEDGTYMFFYHCMTGSKKDIWLELMHGSTYVNSIYAKSGYFDTGSNSAIRVVKRGESVYIRGRGGSTFYGTSDDIYCTFQGSQLN